MPGVKPPVTSEGPPLVVVTGANGYIAMWTIDRLLEEGYSVRGVVRTQIKGERLLQLLAKYGDRLTYAIVPDITQPGAFNDIVKDADAIIHTACPLMAHTEDPDELIAPALHGTMSIIQSAYEHGPNVKRVVITSSTSSVIRPFTDEEKASQKPVILDETSWGDDWVNMLKEGKPVSQQIRYRAAKTLGERAAWNFVKEHYDTISWDLVALNPTFVIGPSLYGDPAVKSPQDLNVSRAGWYGIVFNKVPEPPGLEGAYGLSHVRDVALAHVLALQNEDAGGHRFVISAADKIWQESRNFVTSVKPYLVERGIIPAEDYSAPVVHQYHWNTEKSRTILGLQYTDPDEVVKEMLDEFEHKGFFNSST